jgi:hypothetical protein
MVANMPPPLGWGDDTLSVFFDQSRNNVFARFENPTYRRLAEIDKAYGLICNNLVEPPDWFVTTFLPRAHSVYRAAAHLALAGQLPETYMLLRGCLEDAVYGFYFLHKPNTHELWLRRHENATAGQVVRDEFKIGKMLRFLTKHDTDLGSIVKALYDRTIDYGAHPNERGVMQSAKMTENQTHHRFDVVYLSGNNKALAACLKSTAQVGVASLKVFRHALPEHYDRVGVTALLPSLQDGL